MQHWVRPYDRILRSLKTAQEQNHSVLKGIELTSFAGNMILETERLISKDWFVKGTFPEVQARINAEFSGNSESKNPIQMFPDGTLGYIMNGIKVVVATPAPAMSAEEEPA